MGSSSASVTASHQLHGRCPCKLGDCPSHTHDCARFVTREDNRSAKTFAQSQQMRVVCVGWLLVVFAISIQSADAGVSVMRPNDELRRVVTACRKLRIISKGTDFEGRSFSVKPPWDRFNELGFEEFKGALPDFEIEFNFSIRKAAPDNGREQVAVVLASRIRPWFGNWRDSAHIEQLTIASAEEILSRVNSEYPRFADILFADLRQEAERNRNGLLLLSLPSEAGLLIDQESLRATATNGIETPTAFHCLPPDYVISGVATLSGWHPSQFSVSVSEGTHTIVLERDTRSWYRAWSFRIPAFAVLLGITGIALKRLKIWRNPGANALRSARGIRNQQSQDADQSQLAVRDGIDAEQFVLAADMSARSPEANAVSDASDDVSRHNAETAHMGSARATSHAAPGETRMTRKDLLTRLSQLLPSQFEEVLFRAKIPTAHLPGPSAPQASRAIDALRHLELKHQLDQLARILDEIAGPS